MNEQQQQAARYFAKYIWWKKPEEAVLWERRLIAQVMNLGNWEDTLRLENTFDKETLIDAVQHAEAGWFTPRMWHFWHYRLDLAKTEEGVPTIPVRRFS